MTETTLAQRQTSPDRWQLSAPENTQSRHTQTEWGCQNTGYPDGGRPTHPTSNSANTQSTGRTDLLKIQLRPQTEPQRMAGSATGTALHRKRETLGGGHGFREIL